MALIECVPNVSEGRRGDIVGAIADAIRRTNGARLLDYPPTSRTTDPCSHSPVTRPRGTGRHGDLRPGGRGDRPPDAAQRTPPLGAVDVVPFVPLDGSTMADCIALARRAGAAIAGRFRIPVYLYEEAASNPTRKKLEDIRRGEFEGLAAKMASEGWAPDFGPSLPHPTAGVSGRARMPLIAYNVNLATDRLDVAKKVASAVRHSSGGYQYVKAMGVALESRGIVQVSMNLTNYAKTPMALVFDAVKREAARYGVDILESEIVGLVPAPPWRPSMRATCRSRTSAPARFSRQTESEPLTRSLSAFSHQLSASSKPET